MKRTNRYLPADSRRAVTVEAVVALAGAQNPSDITTAAIAKQMRLTQGALFRHFRSKEAIWQAVMEWVRERLLDRLDRSAAGAGSPLAAMEAMFMSHVEFVVEHPGVPRMLFGELQRSGRSPARRIAAGLLHTYAERLQKLIREGVERGEIAPDIDADAAAMLFIGTVQGLVVQSLISGDVAVMRLHAPRVFGVFRRAIRGTP